MSRRTALLTAWTLVLLLAAGLRLADLETRVLSHDEAIHASLTHNLVERLQYTQDPTYHGPLLYHLTGLSFFLFGDNDATARLPVAIVSIGGVLLFGLFRRTLGEGGALGAGLLYSVSPILLFYSRYLRNDLFVVAATLVWVAMMFRYLERRNPRWLFLMVAAMAFSFAAKENSFITGAIFGLYTLSRWATRPSDEASQQNRAAAADLSILMVTLVLPYASGALLVLTGSPALWDGSTSMLLRSLVVAGSCAAVSTMLAGWWFGRNQGRRDRGGPGFAAWARLAGWFWIPQLILFTGLFTAPGAGFVNGVGGSLAYWLEQHGVERGGQPLFYYLLLLTMYELLPLALAAGGLVLLLRRRQLDWSPTPFGSVTRGLNSKVNTGATPAPARHRRALLEFLVWWALASFFAYSLAGERMPWLTTHIVLPLVLLGGWFGALLLHRFLDGLREILLRDLIWPWIAGCLVGVTALAAVAGFSPSDKVRPPLALLLFLAALLLFASLRARRIPRGVVVRGVSLGLVSLLLLITVRASWQASFVHQDDARELLVYAHSSADTKRLLERFERLEVDKGAPLVIRHTSPVAWPLVWYLRSEPDASILDDDAPNAGDADIVMTGAALSDGAWSSVARGYDETRAVRTWWPVDAYRFWSLSGLVGRLLDPGSWRQALDVMLFREFPGVTVENWPNREDVHVFVRRKDGVTPPIGVQTLQATESIEGPWGIVELLRPADVAAMPDRGWLIADVGANQVVWIDRDGELVQHWTEAAGQSFQEPWGLAVDQEGRIAIADTWNNRVVWSQEPVRADTQPTWESWSSAETPLYGPRDLVFDGQGNLWFTDTGNGRVLQMAKTNGSASPITVQVVADALDEPVGLALVAGKILVAEAWSQRLRPLGTTRVGGVPASIPAWRSRAAKDKPYLTALGASGLLASDPASGRILRLLTDADGSLVVADAIRVQPQPRESQGSGQPEQIFRPIGVAAQPKLSSGTLDPAVGQQVAVADADGGRVVLFVLSADPD